MNSSITTDTQLWHLAKKLSIPVNEILFKDHLEQLTPKMGGYIINMADSNMHGTHWIGLWLGYQGSKPCAHYFDSFGIKPPNAVMDFAHKWGASDLIVSDEEIQNINSGHCGQYVLDFLAFMNGLHGCNRLSLNDRYLNFLKQFKG